MASTKNLEAADRMLADIMMKLNLDPSKGMPKLEKSLGKATVQIGPKHEAHEGDVSPNLAAVPFVKTAHPTAPNAILQSKCMKSIHVGFSPKLHTHDMQAVTNMHEKNKALPGKGVVEVVEPGYEVIEERDAVEGFIMIDNKDLLVGCTGMTVCRALLS